MTIADHRAILRGRMHADPLNSSSKRSPRLNLAAIESSLEVLQDRFDLINPTLNARRDALSDEVLANMMAGYRYVDDLLAADIDLFELGQSRRLLELNTVVLCGTDKDKRRDYARHIAASEQHFYEQVGGGVGRLMDWLRQHRSSSVWRRAAGAYIEILIEPELFIEGNHRTGALIMSYILVRGGQPSFVLTVDTAKAFFDPSTLAKETKRHGLVRLARLPRLRSRFAGLLKTSADASYIAPSPY